MTDVAVVYLIGHDDGRGCGGEEGLEEEENGMTKETWTQKQIQTLTLKPNKKQRRHRKNYAQGVAWLFLLGLAI